MEHNHGNLQEWISTASELAVKNRIVPQPEIVNGILDAHLGKVPETFTVNGKEYTPMSFYQSLGLKASDYVWTLIFPPVSLKAKWFVLIFVAIELFSGITGTAEGVAHFAHLGGMLFGWLLILYWKKTGRLFRY